MAAKASNLTNSSCDFVVATTQASINSGLLELLNEETQPKQYVCFVKKSRKDPAEQISLEDLLVQTEGVNPFYIPDQTPEDDERISKLKGAHFKAGVMLQMGIPEGYTRQNLPPIVTLKTADSVTFNLYCKQARVVSMEFDEDGAFLSVCEQPKGPSGDLWTMTMSVDLTTAGLDDKLNTDYFNRNLKLKSQLLKALYNLSGTAFSLQQLLFDFDNGLLEKTPNFSNVTNKQAKFYLEEYFRDIYVKAAKEQGLSLVAVTVVSQDPDTSSLHMTGFERTVTKVGANNGEASTLNYLCAINNHSVPSPNTYFDWNWVSPEDINQESGVIAINRNILAQHIAEKLKPACAESCYLPIVSGEYTMELRGGQAPTVTFPPEGTKVIQFKYATDTWIPATVKGMALDGSTEMVRINISPEYDCDVYFNRNIIVVDQKLWILIIYNPDERGGGAGRSLVKRGVTDTYEISADQTGALHLTRTDEKTWDDSTTGNPGDDPGWNIYDYLNQKFRDQIYDLASGRLHEFQISQIENFVFPGARTFTYKEPCFSDHQDLVCKITYLDPHEVSPSQDPKKPQGTQEGEDDQTSAEDPPPPSPLPIQTGTVGKLTASTALMQNYIQGEIVSPTGKFEALQTGDGHALLFGIDSAGAFHVIEEQSGTLHTGWQVHDLSTAAIQVQFPGETRAVVRTFDVGQSVVDGSIGLMMAVQLDGNDHLFFSLGNSNEDLSWITSSHWTMVPFDPVNEVPQKIAVRGALFAETEECKQYLVVDIDRPSQNATDPHIARYHIDSACISGHYWVKHDVTIDLAASSYQSAVGRMRGKPVDGIYNAGTSGTGGAGQLIYEPVINAYGDGPAAPVRLELPGGAIPSAIATAHSDGQDGSTDLYTVGGSTLYCFPADWEEGVSEPLALCTSDFLAGTDTLRAMTHGGITTLWGRNQSNQVYYLSSPTSQVFTPAAWSAPVPILTEIEHMSAYVNCADGGNTIFTAGNGRLERIIQGSEATGRVWRTHEIVIAAPPQQKCISIRSYTTTIHATQSNGKSPIPKATVQLSSNSRAPVYINGIYYVLNPVTPVLVSADATGTLTVVETIDSLQAAVLTVSLANTTLVVNPMDNTMAKINELSSAEKLRGAQVPTQIIAGGIMDSPGLTLLVDPSTNDEDVEAVAHSLGLLKDAYDKIRDPSKTPSVTETSICRDPQPQALVRSSVTHLARAKATNFGVFDDFWHTLGTAWGDFKDWLGSVGDAIAAPFGDLWQGLKHEGEAFGRLFCDAGSGLWHFVVRIGGKVFHTALDTWHSFIGAANWLIGKVVDFAKNAWAWFQSLLNWPDIRRTKQVAHNVIRLWMQHQVDQIPEIARRWDQTITEFRNTVNQFAGITDFSPLDDSNNVLKKPATEGAANPNECQTPDSLLLANKYRDHAHELTILGDNSATTDGVEGLLNDLLTAISQEGAILGAVLDQLQKLIKDFSTLSIEEILKRLMGIVADTVLSSVQVVVDALLKVLHTVAQSLVNVLDTKVHIPVISDLLNLVGVPDLSFLDLFAWIIGMAYTVVYKITHNKQAPFPAHDNTVSAMISANSWGELTALFGQPSDPGSFSSFAARPSQLATSSSAPETYWFRHGHTLAALVGIPLTGKAMADAEGESMPTQAAVAGFVLTVTAAGLQASANLFSPRDPITNKIITYSSDGVLAIRLGCLGYFSGAFKSVTEWIGGKVRMPKIGKLQIKNAQGIGAIVDAVLVLPSIAVTGWHIGELIQKPAGKVRSAAILEECGNVVSYISRASTAIALNDPEPDSKEIAVGLAGATTMIVAGFQFAEAEWC
ncbi:uncharacterized protein Aud_006927 [Aspergillus udagawae]|uniref:Uncharacterized protein n=1 Tax=Aspergillus udagawae TaxID=91492 RepID=A0A8E0V0H0_9EURO|nr:uncharacterized protein Aud_006927 [Aspergillus udagawae]GIC90493.1 hypothetical protein Aud_006927 [Aspergillus udagawae]